MRFIDANGDEYQPTRYLSFDDVLLTPRHSLFTSRNDPNISLDTQIGHLDLSLPVISANMDTVTGAKMAIAMHQAGGLGILHRFYSTGDAYENDMRKVIRETNGNLAISVGCKMDFAYETINNAILLFEQNDIQNMSITVCIDVAHGDMIQCHQSVKELHDEYGSFIDIIAGNVATPEAAIGLASQGASTIKVGVGPGSLCSTRIVTGHGIPQLTAIMRIRQAIDEHNELSGHQVNIIADGGIKTSGDIIKALAAGADAVMCGNLFAGTDESPGEIISHNDGTKAKMYRGQSSKSFLDDIGKNGVAPEGEMMMKPYKGGVDSILKHLRAGIRSGMTYSGAGTIEKLRMRARFVEITHSGWVESNTHALMT